MSIYYLILFILSLCNYIYGFELDCKCGVELIQPKVVNGKQVRAKSIGWTAGLFLQQQFVCGASLINDRYVLTAAHCLDDDFSNYKIVLSGFDILKLADSIVLFPLEFKIHPNAETPFSEGTTPSDDIPTSDIALILFQPIVKFEEHILPICLPPPNFLSKFWNFKFAGWGKIGENQTQSYRLLSVPLKECEINQCISIYGEDVVSLDNICAGNSEHDACSGDSGGGLMFRVKGKVFVVGIASWNYDCGSDIYPTVFTRVSSYLDWIYNNTRDAQYCAL